MPYEYIPSKDKHDDNGCGGDLEIKVDRAKKRVVVSCKKCRKVSMIENGNVILDGADAELP
jgi:hypothetical protein